MFFDIDIPNLQKPKIKAKYRNAIEFQQHLARLTILSLQEFKWDGLPDTVDPNVIEWALLKYGQCACITDEFDNILILPSANGGNINVYGYPINAYAYALNGYMQEFQPYVLGSNNLEECTGVICYDNKLRRPLYDIVILTAERMADCIRSIDTAAKKLKIPYWVTGSNKQKPTIQKILDDVDNNVDNVVTEEYGVETFKILNSQVNPDTLRALWDNYNNIFDLYKDLFGYNNNAQNDKKERVLTMEIGANNDTLYSYRQSRLEERQKFADLINSKYGLDVTVEIVSDSMDTTPQMQNLFAPNQNFEGGENNDK